MQKSLCKIACQVLFMENIFFKNIKTEKLIKVGTSIQDLDEVPSPASCGQLCCTCLDESTPPPRPSALTSHTSATAQTCLRRRRSMDWGLETPETLPAARHPAHALAALPLQLYEAACMRRIVDGRMHESKRRWSEISKSGCCLIDSCLEISIGNWLNICRDLDRTPAAMAWTPTT